MEPVTLEVTDRFLFKISLQIGKEPKPRYTSVNDLAKSLDLPENHETQISVVKQNHDFLKKVTFYT